VSGEGIDRGKDALTQADKLLARADRDWKSAVDQVEWSLREASLRVGDYSKRPGSYSASMIAEGLADGMANAGIARLMMTGSYRDQLATAKTSLERDIAQFGVERVFGTDRVLP
jgi:hypothetical protein